MSDGKPIPPPVKVAVDSGGGRLVVPVPMANTGPILNAVGRMVKPD